MKIRIVLLILAIVFGIAAVFGVMIYLNNVRSTVEADTELAEVLVASEDMIENTPVSDMLSKNLVETKQMPKKYIVENSLNSLEKYDGYVAKSSIGKGEQITPSKLIKLEDVRISFTVPEGKVAVSIPYDVVRSVSNFLKPGDKVNVIATFEPGDDLSIFNKEILAQMVIDLEKEKTTTDGTISESTPTDFGFPTSFSLEESDFIVYPLTKIILWNIEVLHIGYQIAEVSAAVVQDQNTITNSDKKDVEEVKTITVAVTPEESERLIFTYELGKAWLSLVPAGGIEEQETPGRNYLDIIDQ